MGRTRQYEGVRSRSDKSIEIDFVFKGVRCRETFKLAPTASNLKKVHRHREVIIDAIERRVFDYETTFPQSKNRFKFAEQPLAAGLKLEDYLESWITTKKKQLKSSTWNGYKKIIALLNRSKLGPIYITELRRIHVREWCNKQSCTNKWLANVQSVLRSALQDAVDDDLIDSNPLFGWKYVNSEALKATDDIDPFDTIEREAILAACNDPQHRNLFELAFWTGLRTSEQVALTWDDVDWPKKIITINKGKTQCAETPEPPKTKKSVREVKLLEPAMRTLLRQKEITFSLRKVCISSRHAL